MIQVSKLIGIAILGMDRRSADVLRSTFDRKMSGICNLVKLHECDAVIIDLDCNNFGELWQQVRQDDPDLPVIVLSTRPQNIKGTLYLRKPFSVSSFTGLLKLLFAARFHSADPVQSGLGHSQNKATRSSSQQTGANPMIVPQVDAEGEFFDPRQFAIYHIKQAWQSCNSQNPFKLIECWNNKSIVINALDNTISTDFQHGSLRALGLVHVDQEQHKINVKSVKQSYVENLEGVSNVYSIDVFLWKLGLLTARGRIPFLLDDQHVFDLESIVYIRQWPNFTRLDGFPAALRITAMWIQHPCSLASLSTLLGVKQALVNNLFSAAYFCGVAGLAVRQADAVIKVDKPLPHQQHDLIGKVVHRLDGLV